MIVLLVVSYREMTWTRPTGWRTCQPGGFLRLCEFGVFRARRDEIFHFQTPNTVDNRFCGVVHHTEFTISKYIQRGVEVKIEVCRGPSLDSISHG